MKSNEDLKLINLAIKAVITFNGEPKKTPLGPVVVFHDEPKKKQLGSFCVSFFLYVVDELHDKGVHQMAHKLDDAICVAVEKYGVAL